MMHHYRKQHQEDPHICDECGRSFKGKHHVKKHKMLVHEKKFYFECVQCNAKFKQRKDIKRHVLQHSGLETYECSICGERFKNNPAAYTHRQQQHNNEGKVLMVLEKEQERVIKALIKQLAPTTDRPYERATDGTMDD